MTSIPLRKLGVNGPEVPALGYGMMGLSQPVYGTVSSEQAKLAMLDRAYELGARHWDSSEYTFPHHHPTPHTIPSNKRAKVSTTTTKPH
jgi:predicted aldo/keto reductase-like oxidoreductase